MTDAISSILSQIRAHEMRTRGAMADAPASTAITPPGAGGIAGPAAPATGFQQTLTKALDQVNQTQANASSLQQAFEMGDPRADLARVMVAMQQSQVAFRATVEVRNRLVQAYQDVMNMPV
ncbi:flagellar hook-basal body complex protein FliE [Lysobacter yangpyeongensis]|uniref:Flagellar hook-basal body complex protein FliE n=1 Tax=Lysobacter yangpyeongensis TaxID=346182 RepID=A0ABW0SJ11_9GAMM